MKAALFLPCYVDQVLPPVARATVALLERLGVAVEFPREQTCCGQPAFNTGYWQEAAKLAQQQIRIFMAANVDAIVCPSGSCAAMQKVFYPTLLAGTVFEATAKELAAKTYELSQFLVNKLGVVDVGATFRGKATLHPSCHSLRELNARTEARTLLERVRGLELVPLDDAEECCGFGGTFAVKMGEISTAMADIKSDAIAKTGADWLIGGDSSCLMHLGGRLSRRGLPIMTIHLAEVLVSVE